MLHCSTDQRNQLWHYSIECQLESEDVSLVDILFGTRSTRFIPFRPITYSIVIYSIRLIMLIRHRHVTIHLICLVLFPFCSIPIASITFRPLRFIWV